MAATYQHSISGQYPRHDDLSAYELLKNIGESAAVLDPCYRILWIHEPSLKLKSDAVGKTCFSVIAKRSSPCQLCPVRQALIKKERQRYRKKIINENGASYFRESRAYPIIDAGNNEISHVIRVSFDVSTGNFPHNYSDQSAYNINQAIQNLQHKGYQGVADSDFFIDYRKPLSVREFEILYLAAKGFSNSDIADFLSISAHTVKSHFDHIFNKLGVSNRTMAVVWAARQGMLN